jgi:membrane protein required for colicin V production
LFLNLCYTMAFIDIVIAVVLVFAAYKGIRNGLFVELASVISFFIGVYLAVKFSYIVANMLSGMVAWNPGTIKITAFVLTLILVIVGVHLLAKIFSGIASFVFLGWLNTLGGAVFGVLKSVLLLGILLGLLQKININNFLVTKETQDTSIFFNPILKTSSTLLPMVTTWFEAVTKELKSDTE